MQELDGKTGPLFGTDSASYFRARFDYEIANGHFVNDQYINGHPDNKPLVCSQATIRAATMTTHPQGIRISSADCESLKH